PRGDGPHSQAGRRDLRDRRPSQALLAAPAETPMVRSPSVPNQLRPAAICGVAERAWLRRHRRRNQGRVPAALPSSSYHTQAHDRACVQASGRDVDSRQIGLLLRLCGATRGLMARTEEALLGTIVAIGFLQALSTLANVARAKVIAVLMGP